jgi:hypothetical protein
VNVHVIYKSVQVVTKMRRLATIILKKVRKRCAKGARARGSNRRWICCSLSSACV